MKTIAITMMLLLAVTSKVLAQMNIGPVEPLSPMMTNSENGYLYLLLTPGNWTDSEARAEALGGHLATINSQAEEDWIFNTFSSYGVQQHNLWIGLNDIEQPSNFTWASDAPVIYTNWRSDQPDNEWSYVAIMYALAPSSQLDWGWIDWGNIAFDMNSRPFNGVVEIVPEPNVMILLILGLTFFILFARNRQTTV